MARFKIGNKAAEKWSEQEAIKAFEEMLSFTLHTKQVLSVQQAYIEYSMHPATYYYLTEKFPVLESYKKGISDIIIARVNEGAITNEMNPTASIWRMKQLGERETQYQEVNSTVQQTNIIKLGKGKNPE